MILQSAQSDPHLPPLLINRRICLAHSTVLDKQGQLIKKVPVSVQLDSPLGSLVLYMGL